ncbi:hypothetical protein M405DRAFT_554610 [Rhizopogon salebrosus TDB-379]|nr:hypothetical protein M405DRAFT_554610 [Rhizopogon salebrosus TDB-379]
MKLDSSPSVQVLVFCLCSCNQLVSTTSLNSSSNLTCSGTSPKPMLIETRLVPREPRLIQQLLLQKRLTRLPRLH